MSLNFEKVLKQYEVTIKTGLFSKPEILNIDLYKERIVGNIYLSFRDEDGVQTRRITKFDVRYDEIDSILEATIDKMDSVRINLKQNNPDYFYFIPVTNRCLDLFSSILELRNAFIDRYNFQSEYKLQLEQEELEKKEQLLYEAKEFYNNVLLFHLKDNTPKYILEENEIACSLLYIDENKNINLLAIDAYEKKEVCGCISYDEIHYYEKAGTIHYVSEINANYTESSSFGGSLKPSNYKSSRLSIGYAILGGLLFGPMGMAVGVMKSYNKNLRIAAKEYKPPKYIPSHFEITSNAVKIDERSVILNYFSPTHKQYMDIELPQEIYNFLQTHLAEKKYDIVIETEKKKAIDNIDISPNLEIAEPLKLTISPKERLMKLKDLFDCDLISEDEYCKRKSEILAEI